MTTIPLAPSRLRDLGELLATEYLVPNGLAGYTMGTAAGGRTRQYHGFLVAALVPPVERALLVAQVDIAAQVGNESFPLSTHLYGGGTVDPEGYRRTTAFALVDGLPRWTHALGAGRTLTETHWLAHGENSTILRATYDAPPDAPPPHPRFKPPFKHPAPPTP